VAEVLRHALKVDFWDTDRLAELILAVLRHEPLGAELRQMAERELLELHWHAAAGKVAEAYGRLLGH
jgi:hypothetical protein